MTNYYETRFYPDYSNTNKFILLASIERIISSNDICNNFVKKSELIKYYGSTIREKMINNKSRIIEIVSSNLSLDFFISHSLKIK